MIRNYIKMAFRSLMKNKGFTVINVLGLALGLATCLLIVFYVFDELSYDRYNEKADRIYRVNDDIKFGGVSNSYAVSPAPLAAAMKADFPEIEQTVRFREKGGSRVKKGNQNIQEDMMIYADPSIFDVFTLPMIDGNPATSLTEPHSVVVTEKIAQKYFNRTNVVGEVLTFNDTAQYKITGVIKDIPQQSHFRFDFFISMPTLGEAKDISWFDSNFNTYILLKSGADSKKLEAKFNDFYKIHAGPQLESILHLNFAKFEQAGNYIRINLIPVKKIHLYSNRVAEFDANGNIDYVYTFSAIAIFILLIACVNFMNLSTARSANRAREVGVRKVLGSARKYLIAQFLTESIMVTLLGALIAVFAAWALLPLFNQMSGKELIITPQIVSWLVPALFIIIIVIGCLAGSYPALFLSGFNPIEVLKGKLASGFKGGLLRSFLVVFQFSISIILIIGTLVIYNQLKFIQNKDLGYNRAHVLSVGNMDALGSSATTFKQEVKQIAGVTDASLAEALPTWNYGNSTSFFKDEIPDPKRALHTQIWGIDEDYINTLGMKVVKGRNFSKDMLTDSSGLIINEAAEKILAYSDPLNQKVYVPKDNLVKNFSAYHIIGVVKDFNFKSLRLNVTPLVFRLNGAKGAFCVRVNSANIPALLAQIKKRWTDLAPNHQFDYSFLDQQFDSLYRSEQRIGTIFIAFTSLAIIIACLGLFGLAVYAAEQRTKEIGIRKILGADMSTIVGMLSKDFIKLVGIAILIGSPIAWWGMKQWLQGFAYRQNIQWWEMALAGLTAVVIAFITISFQSIKAALTNPVNSLRSE
ncbi:ABC transporter permease [Mucilaginibacter sp. X4EP1]|uniref:ABC transporter permease n=1 Tax=Mucilaginibacter sp. X4EP1 TaxID=2723092 RepID=UPI002169D207|nr:ABC transporter permease [Mucilaginibacter sp. X4EP1]MCS3813236.1 putative ABC transport system permease protein [Mucilaginibacter sp. X4EP1]